MEKLGALAQRTQKGGQEERLWRQPAVVLPGKEIMIPQLRIGQLDLPF